MISRIVPVILICMMCLSLLNGCGQNQEQNINYEQPVNQAGLSDEKGTSENIGQNSSQTAAPKAKERLQFDSENESDPANQLIFNMFISKYEKSNYGSNDDLSIAAYLSSNRKSVISASVFPSINLITSSNTAFACALSVDTQAAPSTIV